MEMGGGREEDKRRGGKRGGQEEGREERRTRGGKGGGEGGNAGYYKQVVLKCDSQANRPIVLQMVDYQSIILCLRRLAGPLGGCVTGIM